MVALAASGVGILVASIPPAAFLSKVLSGAGLLLALLAGLSAAGQKPGAAWLSLPVAGLCLLALVFAGNWPQLQAPPPPAVVAIPLGKAGMMPNRPIEDSEWVDAAEWAVRRDDLRVHVVSARVGPAELRKGEEGPALSPTKHLVLQVAVLCEGTRAPEVAYQPWADLDQAPSRHPPTLTDDRGQRYPQDTFDAVAGRGERTPSIIGMQIREILVFPVPPAEVEYLRLELPASAYGGQGAFRFQVPRSMIQFLDQGHSQPRSTP
jgi:hypothetical protein